MAVVTITEDAYGLTVAIGERPEWRRHGLCVGVDPELFFPTRGDSPAEAKAICAECSVRVECLEYALSGPKSRPPAKPRAPTIAATLGSVLPAGIYVDGVQGTPHYFVSLTDGGGETFKGSVGFLAQDGQTSVTFYVCCVISLELVRGGSRASGRASGRWPLPPEVPLLRRTFCTLALLNDTHAHGHYHC